MEDLATIHFMALDDSGDIVSPANEDARAKFNLRSSVGTKWMIVCGKKHAELGKTEAITIVPEIVNCKKCNEWIRANEDRVKNTKDATGQTPAIFKESGMPSELD